MMQYSGSLSRRRPKIKTRPIQPPTNATVAGQATSRIQSFNKPVQPVQQPTPAANANPNVAPPATMQAVQNANPAQPSMQGAAQAPKAGVAAPIPGLTPEQQMVLNQSRGMSAGANQMGQQQMQAALQRRLQSMGAMSPSVNQFQ
jgi:hypothetical protein